MSILCANSWITTLLPSAGRLLSARAASHEITIGPLCGLAKPMVPMTSSVYVPATGPACATGEAGGGANDDGSHLAIGPGVERQDGDGGVGGDGDEHLVGELDAGDRFPPLRLQQRRGVLEQALSQRTVEACRNAHVGADDRIDARGVRRRPAGCSAPLHDERHRIVEWPRAGLGCRCRDRRHVDNREHAPHAVHNLQGDPR